MGKFIVFEGPDGCGKSTMVEALERHLEAKNIDALFVRDPGGTELGAKIRTLLLDPENEEMCPMTELLLYAASRAQLVEEKIRPALEAGRLVICDRFYLSTLVYQGVQSSMGKHGLDENKLKEVVMLGAAGLEPDHILLLDVPAEIGLERVGSEQDRMELRGLMFFEEVRQRYLGFADATPEDKLTIIDSTRSILEVKKDILERVDELIC